MNNYEHAVSAIKQGNLGALQKLISEAGFSATELYELLRTAIMPDSKTPRHPNRKDMVQALIDAGADINGTPQKGPAPLQGAVSVNDVEMAKFLLQRGANPNGVPGDTVRTPLQEARRWKHAACEQLLVEHGATCSTSRLTTIAPQFLVDDVAKAVAYYHDKLGFEEDFIHASFYASVSRDGFPIHLKCAPKTVSDRQHRKQHEHLDAYIGVAGVDALYEELQTRGARIIKPLENRPWACRDFYVEDMDGYILCFREPKT